MTMPDTAASGAIVWDFDFALSTFFEIDTRLVQPLIPRRLSVLEAAPGISLVNVTAFNFTEGALGFLPEFQELTFSVVVSPDLSKGVPKFAMYVLSLSSTCQPHLDHSADYYKLPSSALLTHVTIDKDIHFVEYADAQGKILTMKNCSLDDNYEYSERYFQAFSSTNGEIYVADMQIKASLREHQQSGDVGRLRNHPFFLGVDIESVEPVSFLQIVNEPGITGKQVYYRPERFS